MRTVDLDLQTAAKSIGVNVEVSSLIDHSSEESESLSTHRVSGLSRT